MRSTEYLVESSGCVPSVDVEDAQDLGVVGDRQKLGCVTPVPRRVRLV